MTARAQNNDAIRARLTELQPVTGDFGRPEQIADAVLYLAGAEFVTGVVLPVDGGWTVH
jgi:NAD(P)-dependent dehydrogenase (short-subunit alcohol dehydrogenase family)